MTAITTPVSPKGMHPDVTGIAPRDVIPAALILQTSTRAGVVEGDEPALRVPYVTFTDDAAFVPEGEEITEAAPDYSEVTIFTGKVAILARVSYEQMAQAGAASLVTDSMRRALTLKADAAFVAQAAPSPPATNPPAGLLALDHAVGDEISVNVDPLVDAVATIEGAGGQATHVIAAPAAWASLSKIKVGTGSEASLLGAGTAAVERSVLGVPVVVSSAMPADTLLVLDRSAVLSAYSDVRLATSTDVYFSSDSVGLRLTFRFGVKLVDPLRAVELVVAGDES